MRRLILVAIATAVILYIIPLVLVYILQRSFMYFPPEDYLSPSDMNVNAEEVQVTTASRDNLQAWWMPPSSSDVPIILFFHGNGSAIYSNHDIYTDLQLAGYGVMAVGYPGYPGSTGAPKQADIVAGAQAHYDWMLAQGIAPDRIVFFGTSLGSGIAAQLATTRKPAMLIMDAPFNSTLDMGRLSMPIFPVSVLMKDQYRSDLALIDLNVPLLWIHGTDDDVIPFSQGQKLYDAYTGPKASKVIEGGEHTNLWGLGGREKVLETLSRL